MRLNRISMNWHSKRFEILAQYFHALSGFIRRQLALSNPQPQSRICAKAFGYGLLQSEVMYPFGLRGIRSHGKLL